MCSVSPSCRLLSNNSPLEHPSVRPLWSSADFSDLISLSGTSTTYDLEIVTRVFSDVHIRPRDTERESRRFSVSLRQASHPCGYCFTTVLSSRDCYTFGVFPSPKRVKYRARFQNSYRRRNSVFRIVVSVSGVNVI